MGQTKNCWEIVLANKISGQVTQSSVQSYLPSDYKDILNWKAGTLTNPKSIGIQFDADLRKVVVA